MIFIGEDSIFMFEEIKKIDSEYVIHSYGRVDVAIECGKGSKAVDVEGKEYIDFTSGIGVNSLGYSHPKWVEAVSKQASKVQHLCNYYLSPTATELAKKLAHCSGLSRMFFANSGCEANECAIKIARKAKAEKKAYKIITLNNSFHGRTLTTLAATGQEVFHSQFLPLTDGFLHCEPNDLKALENMIDDTVCAVMLECVQGEGGVLPLDTSFLQNVRKLCDEKDILLILDEVQTGVGRTGKLFGFQHADILPDVMTLAKGLGGGLPIGVCLVADKYKDVLVAGDHGSTYGANPVCCAGALAVLDEINNDKFLKSISEKGEYIKNKLLELPEVDFVRGQGLMIGIALKEKKAKDVLINSAKNGLLILTAKDLVRFLPPLNITYDEIDTGLDIFKEMLK